MHHNISPIALLMLIALIAHPSYAKLAIFKNMRKLLEINNKYNKKKIERKNLTKFNNKENNYYLKKQ